MRRLALSSLLLLLVAGCASSNKPARLAARHFGSLAGGHGSGRIFGTTPVNEALPTISGTAEEGKELSATTGTWKFATAYAYQWQKCNASGGECVNIAGETKALIVLTGYAGKKLRVVVTASNSGAQASATSATTEEIKAGAGVTANCYKVIVEENKGCGGDPAESETGVESGITLTAHPGTLEVKKEGEVIKELKIEGNLDVKASNVTVENVEVVVASQTKACEKSEAKPEGSGAVQVHTHGAGIISTGIVFKHVTVHGITKACPSSLSEGFAIRQTSAAKDVKIEWSKVYWTRTCFFQAATYEHNTCNDSAEIPGAHDDGIDANGEGTTASSPGLVIKNNTIIVPHWQTAPLYLPNEKEVGEERIENNFLMGGGYLMYLPGTKGTTPTVKGPITVKGNRLARCLGKEYSSVAPNLGHHLCEGLAEENEATNGVLSPDTHGYFPRGGSYGSLQNVYAESVTTLTENFWDDNLEVAL